MALWLAALVEQHVFKIDTGALLLYSVAALAQMANAAAEVADFEHVEGVR